MWPISPDSLQGMTDGADFAQFAAKSEVLPTRIGNH